MSADGCWEKSDHLSDDNKLQTMVEFLTESHIGYIGGYAYDHDWINETLVVAELDPAKEYNRTMISKYKRDNLLDWYERANKYNRKSKKLDHEAFYETENRSIEIS